MTAKAFVLINAEVGNEQELIEKLRGTPNVTEVHVVYGVYDVIAKVEADTMEKVKETITNSLRRLENVRSTLTMIAVENAQD
jgi:DNA-binding Lrp family transcriptional regulator